MELAVSAFAPDASFQKNEPLRAPLTSFRGYSQKWRPPLGVRHKVVPLAARVNLRYGVKPTRVFRDLTVTAGYKSQKPRIDPPWQLTCWSSLAFFHFWWRAQRMNISYENRCNRNCNMGARSLAIR